ncbi:MAG: MarR family transcriptional regulator [Clostridia bacterium]|jgi:DNA-binding MarR family transcriptional regulator|nr:MarR family transcriptional regulator [Clostridia bacterium]
MQNKEIEIWMLLRKVLAVAQRIAEEDLRKYDSTPSQFGILLNLAEENLLPMSELSKQAACVNSNITSIITRMEAKGLVQRNQDQRDRRIVKVELTPKGKELLEDTLPVHYKFIKDLLDFYTEEELEQLYKLLSKFYENVS